MIKNIQIDSDEINLVELIQIIWKGKLKRVTYKGTLERQVEFRKIDNPAPRTFQY